MNTNSIISVENFSVKRGTFSLKQISFDVKQGEIFAILGKTGSGKTVLLESILGMYKGCSGAIYLHKKEIFNIPIAERNIGIVYQDYQLFPCMNVFENITYALRMRKVKKDILHKTADELLDLFDISNIKYQSVNTISGGECQRVALARTLCMKPDILLLDEPFSALDPATKQKMYQTILRIHDKYSCTILFVTHDFKEAETLANRVAILLRGDLKAVIESKKLMTFDSFDSDVNQFLGRKPAL